MIVTDITTLTTRTRSLAMAPTAPIAPVRHIRTHLTSLHLTSPHLTPPHLTSLDTIPLRLASPPLHHTTLTATFSNIYAFPPVQGTVAADTDNGVGVAGVAGGKNGVAGASLMINTVFGKGPSPSVTCARCACAVT